MKHRSDTTSYTLRFFWQRMWRYPYNVMGVVLIMPLAVASEQFVNMIILANVLNRLATHDFVAGQVWSSFGWSIVAYGGFMFIGSIGWRIIDAFNWRLEANVERDIAETVYHHMLSQSADFHANRFGGSLVSQTNKLMGSYIRFADTTIYQVYQLLIGLVLTIIILAPRAPLFAISLLFFSLIYMASGFRISKTVRSLSAKQASTESKQTGYLADSITNIMAIKSFAGRLFEQGRFAKHTGATRNDLLAVMRASQKQMAFFSVMNRIILIAALVLAVFGVVSFGNNIATVFLIFSYTGNLVTQLWTFCNGSLRNYNRAFGDASDMVEILRLVPEVQDTSQPEAVNISNGEIRFNDVVFDHEDTGNNDSLFDGLDIHIKPGEKVGLVGHSGSGKTTLTRLLLRFADIQGGQITIDGQNIAHITQDDLRSKISYVPQEPLLFHRTIRENIAYGKINATNTEIETVAKLAHATEFVELLPKGYETLVGERGVKLSGGQRQRIAIARAMIKDAPVLVLDEATSALDSESEALIQDALWKLMEGRTAIVIAHRLSTIQKMDRILVMSEGRIVEQGTHKELVNNKGIYADLWAHQSGGFIDE